MSSDGTGGIYGPPLGAWAPRYASSPVGRCDYCGRLTLVLGRSEYGRDYCPFDEQRSAEESRALQQLARAYRAQYGRPWS